MVFSWADWGGSGGFVVACGLRELSFGLDAVRQLRPWLELGRYRSGRLSLSSLVARLKSDCSDCWHLFFLFRFRLFLSVQYHRLC